MKYNFYEKIGVKGLRDLAFEYKVNDDIKFVKAHAKKGQNILDLACGYGRVSLSLAKGGYKHVVGIDFTTKLIRSARKEAKAKKLKVTFDIGDMNSLPYEDDSFDRIFCLWNSFNDVLNKRDQIKTLKEVRRVLKPGGKAFFSLFDGKSTQEGVVKKRFKNADEYQYIHTPATLKNLLKEVSFRKSSITFIKQHQRRRILLTLMK